MLIKPVINWITEIEGVESNLSTFTGIKAAILNRVKTNGNPITLTKTGENPHKQTWVVTKKRLSQ
jgi:hypothetical protein